MYNRDTVIFRQEKQKEMSEDFIQDLNEYFSKKYVNFDLISSMPSYESITISMVLKNRNRIEEGEYAANEMRKIAYQPDPAKILAELKERYVDNNFTFSVRVAPLKVRLKALCWRSLSGTTATIPKRSGKGSAFHSGCGRKRCAAIMCRKRFCSSRCSFFWAYPWKTAWHS